MSSFLEIIAILLASVSAILSVLIFVRLKWPSVVFWLFKLYTSALSPIFILIGFLSTIVGLTTGSIFLCLLGMFNVMIFMVHRFRITRPPGFSNGFERAFGLNWESLISGEQKNYFLPERSLLQLPFVPPPRMEQNISFVTIPGTDRNVLCDIWQPPKHVSSSGLAFIYLHGSAWALLDKDLGTRPFFTHLTSQGHLVMDVAYRLAPETDMMGMLHDVKRAIAWLKENAGIYKINLNRIVVGGGSAGAHLALLAAYTNGNPMFIPNDLEGKDLSVCGVVSLYGPADLEAMYYHTRQHLTTRSIPGSPKHTVPAQMPGWIIKKMGASYYRLNMDKGFAVSGFISLLGGHPDECPEIYARFSPLTHVHPGCPDTLLIHGEHDVLAPVRSTRLLYRRLVENNVPAVLHIIPQTDHAFDLILPKISPSAHNAIYDVERFLALQAQSVEKLSTSSIKKEKSEVTK